VTAALQSRARSRRRSLWQPRVVNLLVLLGLRVGCRPRAMMCRARANAASRIARRSR